MKQMLVSKHILFFYNILRLYVFGLLKKTYSEKKKQSIFDVTME